MSVSLNTMLRLAAVLLVAGGLAIVWAGISEPTVAPNLPAEDLFVIDNHQPVPPSLESLDFVFRPLFAADRRPPEDVDVFEAAADSDLPAERRLKGLTLLGVFASGDRKGVILKRDDGERFRVVEGDKVDGWALVDVDLRAAVFSSGSGASLVEEQLDMGVVTDLPAPASVPTQRASTANLGLSPTAAASSSAAVSSAPEKARDGNLVPAGNGASPAEEAKPVAPTFDAIYKKRSPRGAPRENTTPDQDSRK